MKIILRLPLPRENPSKIDIWTPTKRKFSLASMELLRNPSVRAALRKRRPIRTATRATAARKVARYRLSGKIHNNTVRVLLADQKMLNGLERDKKKLEKHSLATVCDYLAKRNLYSAGSDVPEDILRETYRNAHLAGNVHNNDPDIMINNFMKGGEPVGA